MEELWGSKGGFDITTTWNQKGLWAHVSEHTTKNKYGRDGSEQTG